MYNFLRVAKIFRQKKKIKNIKIKTLINKMYSTDRINRYF